MAILTNYKLTEKLNEGLNTLVYRGKNEQDNQKVIVKILTSEYPTLEEITQLRHEYEISKNLNLAGIVNPYRLENHRNGLALILEDSEGESLSKYIASKKVELKEFLDIGIQLADTLGKIHELGVIHKDIKAKNIIINYAGEVKITDFSIATQLSRETQTLSNPSFLEGTLAYMSPEQTGRMNRSLDYRTDFYSLGITFYEILTERLPFQATDPMELVYCHIAKTPVPPKEVNPEIPAAVSDIVMKLLAKTAEERYQSAYGLKADLEECLTQLQQTGQISNFIVGQRDRAGQFLIPQKLYGREKEVAILMNAFERVSQGTIEMMLVSGYSGIGKSCLVQEIYKPIVRQRGYFIAGKFDQFKRNIPYAALIQAFQELVGQILTETYGRMAVWKEKILNALGQNGQVIIDVIPEVELIIGKQPNVPQLGATESQNRFNRVFKQFIHVFCQKDHPLVVFLDDLQWADSASLKLINLLMTDSECKYLLTIGAYRDNEVSAAHPLMQTLDDIRASGAIANNITLRPLDLGNVSQLVADTLQEEERSKLLAELVFNKTQGNPFFLTQLLKSLYREKFLSYDFTNGCWQWNIKQIQAIGITDYNVVELIANNIRQLPSETQKVLKLAACIGNVFNLDVLAIVHEKSTADTAIDLWLALQEGLILPLSNAYKIPLVFCQEELGAFTFDDSKVAYKFLHDRVQQAAYSLIPETEKQATHLKIGQLLLKNATPEERKENIFDLVNQLNFGTNLITDRSQKDELAYLNLIAGQKSKAATAYEAALKYLNVGLELLEADSWESNYALTLNLYVEAVEAEYLNTNFERSDTIAEVVLQRATTLLDKVKVYELKIQFYMAQNQFLKAIDTGLEAVEKLGIQLSQATRVGDEVVNLPKLADLENIPQLTNPHKLAALRILMTIMAPAYFGKPALLPQVTLTMVRICINYGNSSLAAYAYAYYGLLLCGDRADIESGYHSGQLALKLLDRFNAKEIKSKVYNLFNALIRPWKEHSKKSLVPLQEGIQSGLESGDIEYASYCAMNYCTYLFLSNENLEKAENRQGQYIDLLVKLKQQVPQNLVSIWRQLSLNLQGKSVDEYLLVGESFDEVATLPRLQETNSQTALFIAYLAKIILCYLLKDYGEAINNAVLAAEHIEAAVGWMPDAAYNFYYSLALLARYPQVESEEQQKYLDIVEKNQQKMQHWAYHAPFNFQHKYDLVEAEKARFLGRSLEAMNYYERAIQGAKEHGYIQEEALANELAAEFYFSRSIEKSAKVYLTDAYYGYIHWGAKAKVRDLESRYPQFFTQILKREQPSIDVTRTTTSTTGESLLLLDLSTVTKASLAIAEEIVLDKLLAKLLKIVMENAGSRTSCLILKKDTGLVIEATGSVEPDEVILQPSISIENHNYLPLSVINYVEKTLTSVVLDDALDNSIFGKDIYIVNNQPKSILCMPVINQGELIAILYLENNLSAGAFTKDRLEVLKVLSSQVAISLKNALLYDRLNTATETLKQANEKLEDYSRTLEEKVEERTQELKQTLEDLKQTQTQLIQTEKMSSLGQLVAGVAHEINNPVNFIYGNLTHAGEYFKNLIDLVRLYQQELPKPKPEIQSFCENIEIEYLSEDVPKLLNSMQIGADRIRQIVMSLRNFSRLDEADMKAVDIHEGIDSTLLILQHRLKEKSGRPTIQLIKEYGKLPLVECYAGQLNQVFMNILSNAVDALEMTNAKSTIPNPQIRIKTEILDKSRVVIRIADNGIGMTEEVRSRVFDPFFTTKPVGSGTGLGLSISYQIVIEKHKGELKCISGSGEGTEFAIVLPHTLRDRDSH